LLLALVAAGLGLLALAACSAEPTFEVTPTPTRTPVPPTPTPTPTPAWPVSVGCEEDVPEAVCERLGEAVAQDADHFIWTDDPASATLRLTTDPAQATPVGAWTYAVAVPLLSLDDEVTAADLRAVWQGQPPEALAARPLLVTTDTLRVLTSLWDPPSGAQVQVVDGSGLLAEATRLNGLAVLPFDALAPQWHVLRVDTVSLLDKGLQPGAYPLSLPLYLVSGRPDGAALLPADFSNRDEAKMTVVAMTGVTAMTRAFAAWMDSQGNTYAGEGIRDWLTSADFTHVSNEVSFTPDCVAEPSGTMSFCSNDSYIELLEYVGVDIVELTGNHLADKGSEWILHSLDMYRERGWQWFGGGANLADATRPLTVTQGPNRIAFLGCNPVGPEYDWATEDQPGSSPCHPGMRPEIWALLHTQTAELRAQGWLPIVTLQYWEADTYEPSPQQIADFRSLADAGAVVVQGSQAHQAQTLETVGDTFIHYGLGNLFFDQNWAEVLPSFIDRLVFYDGRFLCTDVRVTTMEQYGRRRPMTPEERAPFLEMMIGLSPQGR
jgi:poly-gamma-glutamate synthesis protein (capsule biosynthesis protein)